MIVAFPRAEAAQPRVGRALQGIREARGLSLAQLASNSGISAARLSMAQQDRVRLDSVELHAVINALHIPLELLFRVDNDFTGVRRIVAHFN